MAKTESSPISTPMLSHIVGLAETDALAFIRTDELAGSFHGKSYTLRALSGQARDPFLKILEVETSSKPYVLKTVPRNPREQEYKVPDYISGLIPRQYATVRDWVVEEKLEGLEEDQLVKRLTDKNFRNKYARSAFTLIVECATRNLRLHDVRFAEGHNCMVSPVTSTITFIEQCNVYQYSPYKPSEIVTEQLFTELDSVSSDPNDEKVKFVIELLELVSTVFGPDDLYLRRKKIRPTHVSYERLFRMIQERERKWNWIPDGELLPIFGDGPTRAISDKFLRALSYGQIEKVKELIESGKYSYDLTDPNDPRSAPIILPDNIKV